MSPSRRPEIAALLGEAGFSPKQVESLLTSSQVQERGLTVDVEGFNRLMEEQKARARAAQKKTVIELSQIETTAATEFVGFDKLETPAKVLEVVQLKDKTAVILDTSACYAPRIFGRLPGACMRAPSW